MTTGLGAALVAVLATGHPPGQASAQLMSSSSTAYTGLGYRADDAGLEIVEVVTPG